MKYFDLFSGIGGFSLGIEKTTEAECVGCAEIDKYASAIYKYRFSEVRNYGDVSRINTEELPDFDLLCFGWPCQDLSIAGKRAGLTEGSRSGLLNEAIRILKAKQPHYFIAENVKGLYSTTNGCDFYTAIRMFTDIGYDCQWQLLNTKWFLPQNRERIYFVGHLRGKRRPKVFPIREDAEVCVGRNKTKKAINQNTSCLKARDYASWNGNYLMEITKNKSQAGGLGAKTGLYGVSRHPLKFLQRNQKNVDGKHSFTVDSMNTGGVKINSSIRRLTPIECERLQGFPDNWTKCGIVDGKKVEISDTQRYKCLGNAVTVNVVSAIVGKVV